MLERAINHYAGATDAIEARVVDWVGKIVLEGPLSSLYTTALNANDLRVRAAALEVYLAANGVGKTPESLLTMIERSDDPAAGSRAYFLWIVGVLGNRGVESERALAHLLRYLDDPDLTARQWAVEGIAVLGSDDAIGPLLRVFHDDPSPVIRERAACGLAQSGMLTARQRWTAIPELIRYADDSSLDDQTRGWVFQALSDISGLRLGKDAAVWRAWWENGPHPPSQDAGHGGADFVD
jgi:HEAT repeat protein